MRTNCDFGDCGKEIDTGYGNYQVSPDYPGKVFCWALSGGRDNCLERQKEKDQENQSCVEGDLHTEYLGDICPRCGMEIQTDWNGGN